jgi:O-antigen ligase
MTTLAVMAPAAAEVPFTPLAEDGQRPARIPRSRVVYPALAILYMAATHTYGLSIPTAILLPLAAVVLAALLMNSLRDPTVSLLALAAYIPFSRVYPGHFGGSVTALNLTNVLMGIGLVAWLGAARQRGAPMVPRAPLNLPVALFAILSIVAFVRGGMDMGDWYWEGAIYNLKRWLDPFVIYFLFLGLVRRKETMRNLVIVILMGVLAAALMGIVEHMDLVARFPFDGESQRIKGISEQPNQLGAFFVYYGALFAGLALARPGSRRHWFLLVPFLVIVRATQYTGSRGTMLGLVAAVLCIAFLRSKPLFVGLALAGVVMLADPSLLPEGTQRMLGRTFASEGENIEESLDRSAATRILLWEAALQMIRDEPLLGVGYGRFGELVQGYLPDIGYRDVHNTYLLFAAEMGIPGLLVLLWVLGGVLREAVFLCRRAPDRFFRGVGLGFAGGMAGLLVVCVFGSRITSFEIFGYFWVLAAIVVRANELARAERAALGSERAPVVAPWFAGVPVRS